MNISVLIIVLVIITFLIMPGSFTASPATDITQEAFVKLNKADGDFVLIDVRSIQEFAQGHIKGAINISHSEISRRLSEIPKDKDLILYCRTGRRVGVAAKILAKNGYTKLYHLDGDMVVWMRNNRPLTRK